MGPQLSERDARRLLPMLARLVVACAYEASIFAVVLVVVLAVHASTAWLLLGGVGLLFTSACGLTMFGVYHMVLHHVRRMK